MAMALPLILILLVGVPAIYASSDHTVGGSSGWNTNVNYSTWAAGEEFKIGDTLVFNYATNHKVDIVNPANYGNCATSNAIKTYTGGKTSIPLTVVGPMYFICPVSDHCSLGMKLAINITVVNTTTPTGTTTSPPPPPKSGGSLCHMSPWMLGFSLLVAVVVMGFMG